MLRTIPFILPPGYLSRKERKAIQFLIFALWVGCILFLQQTIDTYSNKVNKQKGAYLGSPLIPAKAAVFVDTDNDGVEDLIDIDDDNDGIPDIMEQYCSNSSLANSISGSGVHQEDIYWFNWTDIDFSNGLQNGDSQTFTLSTGTQITATISNVVNLGNQGGTRYVADDINTWSGARIHYLYNTLGIQEVFHSGGGNGDDVSFDISFSAQKNGRPQYLDYIAFDGESTNGSGEYIYMNTDGGNWVALEHYGSGAVHTGSGTQSVTITNTESSGVGNTIFYSENALQFSISLNSHGGQAIGFGIYLECDSDNDGIFNHLDLDSDNDGIPDIVEAGGADVDGDGRVDNPLDTDNDGLADVFETAHGSSSVLFDPNGDGINEQTGDFDGDQLGNWVDLDSDGDGISDVTEAGGTDNDYDSMLDGNTLDTDADGLADAVDGDVGNNDFAENTAQALIITTADLNNDGQPDLGYTEKNSDAQGFPDFIDIDADDDGIVDNTEAQTTADYVAPTGLDDDLDGIDKAYDEDESVFGGKSLVAENTDGGGNPDYLDLDSDEDNLLDIIEGHDLNGDFTADTGSPANLGTPTGSDIDSDGLDDGYDNNTSSSDPTNSGLQPNSHPNFFGNGDRDWRSLQTLHRSPKRLQAKWASSFVSLSWRLGKHVPVKYFQVLRKTESQSVFEIIGEVSATGDSLYEFKDSFLIGIPKREKIFYQLKWVNLDGKVFHSKTVEVKPIKQAFNLHIYTRPGADFVQIKSPQGILGELQFQVLNIKGDLVYQGPQKTINSQSAQIHLGDLPKGIYILQARNKLGQKSFKFNLE